jgi:carboxyl-terminal processing protease
LEKKDTTVKQKPIALIEEEARKKTLKNNEELFERIKKISYADKISMYLNTVANIYDPHTEFFPVKEKKNFDIRMSGQLEGIGAQLQEKEGYVKVMRIVPGSPSWRQGELKAGDLIIKVAQGNNEPVDVVGMDIDDVVQLIRGKKGTEVRLTVKKPEGNIIIVSLIRDVVLLEETYAKSAIINTKKKIGYIKLPTFYADFENNSGRSCSGDVKKELEKLKAENVEGVILDLRDNGGGSLQDVVTMTGLFIKEGPIVQVKQKSGSPRVLKDYDGDVVYDGPLVIMINENSASASEILAAAIQDYKRGVVVGSSSSFGKGTVQQFLNLDDYLLPQFDSLKPLGSVKLTIQKFYRVNGGSTQLKGVVPDIEMPDVYKYYEYGEKELEYPMPWDEIESLKVDAWKDFGMAQVKKSSTERMQKSERFKLIESKAKKLKSQRDQSMVTLNLEKYKQYRKTLEQEMKQYDSIDDEVKEMNVTLLKVDLQNTDTLAKASGKELLTRMKKDIYLLESANIIGDIK